MSREKLACYGYPGQRGCRVWHGLPVLRQGKWAAEYADIPAEVTSYPTGCSGSFYITTPGTAARTGDRLLPVVLPVVLARSRDKLGSS